MHIQRNFGRALRGTPGKGITVSILAAIYQAGVMDISLRKPQAASTSRRERQMGSPQP